MFHIANKMKLNEKRQIPKTQQQNKKPSIAAHRNVGLPLVPF